MKKGSKNFLGITSWQKRYAVLDGDKLTFYVDETKKQAKKFIQMSKVQTVVYHYDMNAPVVSKKLNKDENDESRFDIYTPAR